MFIYDYVMVTMATILLDVLTIVLRFVISRANRREVMCKNKISKLLEVHAWLHYSSLYTTQCPTLHTMCGCQGGRKLPYILPSPLQDGSYRCKFCGWFSVGWYTSKAVLPR
jgi:hypothetical protein